MEITDAEKARFKRLTRQEGDCLVWVGYCSPDGYGRFRATRNGKSDSKMAHRVAYEHAFGEIPEGKQVDHTCLNPACVTPEHFRVVTNAENCQHRSPRKGSKSGVRGVSWSNGRWHVVVGKDYKHYSGGWFDDLDEARLRAIELRNSLYTHNIED